MSSSSPSSCLGFSASYTLGLFFIVCVSLIWAAASILVQFLYTKESFDSPFLLTYIGVSLFTVLLPTKLACEQIKILWHRCQYKLGNTTIAELEIATSSSSDQLGQYENVPSVSQEDVMTIADYQDDEGDVEGADEEKDDNNNAADDDNDDDDDTHDGVPVTGATRIWTNADHMRAAIRIAPVWFIANWTYNASLAYTSITSSTVLASTGSLFTFLFAVSYKDEQFTCLKFLGVLLGVVGSLLTALHDAQSDDTSSEEDELLEPNLEDGNDDARMMVRLRLVRHLLAWQSVRDRDWWTQERALFGDALGLISAVGYGAYAVMVRVICPRDESLMSMELLLGYIGLFNMLALSPILIYQLTQGNHSQLTLVVFGFLVVKGLLDNVLSDYLWARSVVLTSATVATVGLGLTIPLAFISDVLWMGQEGVEVVSFSSVCGALSVLAGFVLVNIAKDEGQDQPQDNNTSNRDPNEAADSNQQPMQLTEMNELSRRKSASKP